MGTGEAVGHFFALDAGAFSPQSEGKMDLRWGSKDKQEPVYKHWGSGEWTETGEIYCYLSTAHASKVSTKHATVSVKYSKAAASLLLFKPPTSISSMVFPK